MKRYYYNTEDADERWRAIYEGKEPEPIKLYPATGCVDLDFFYNPDSVWWPVSKTGELSAPREFQTLEEAETAFYTREAESIYCYIHDC